MFSSYSFSARLAYACFGLALTLAPPIGPAFADSPALEWDDPVSIATGEAHRGPWRMNDSDFRYVDDPALAIDPAGNALVVWADQAQQNVLLQRWHRAGTPSDEAPVNISRSPDTFSWLPRVVASQANPEHVYVLWQEIIFSGGSHGGEILFARSRDGGATFGEPRNLSNTENGAGKGRLTRDNWHNGSLDLAEGPDGTLWAAWTEYEGRLLVARSQDKGASFSAPRHVAGDDEKPARAPALALDTDARVHLAWTKGEDVSADIRYAIAEDGAVEFSPARSVHTSETRADAPRLAVDDSNRIHLVWGEHPAAPHAPGHILYAQRQDEATFSEPQRLDASGEPGQAGFPQLVTQNGKIHVVWEHLPNPGQRPKGLMFAWSGNGGESFSAPVTVPHSGLEEPGHNGGLQGLLMRKLAATPDGGIAIAHSLFRPLEQSEIRLLRARPAP